MTDTPEGLLADLDALINRLTSGIRDAVHAMAKGDPPVDIEVPRIMLHYLRRCRPALVCFLRTRDLRHWDDYWREFNECLVRCGREPAP